MTDWHQTAINRLAVFLVTMAAVVVVGLVALVVFSCTAPQPLRARDGVRAELGAGCYGPWCFCPYHCGAGWRLDAAHRIWRHSVAECGCHAA